MSTIYHIFKAYAQNDPFPSSHKVDLFPKLRYVLGARSMDLLASRTILSFGSVTLAGRVA